MKYSYKWLQKHIEQKLPEVNELAEKIIFHAFEVEEIEMVGDDFFLEIKVLPDRAGDALSHYGMAREIAGILDFKLKTKLENITEKYSPIKFDIQTDKCTRYSLMHISNLEIKDSNIEVQNLLKTIGQNIYNSVVDATNFVLHDIGQPTHAFDADKIVGNIVIRNAFDGEKIITLSDEEKELNTQDIVIADDEGILAIAGIKGGKRAQVDQNTKNILLEVAHFDATTIRKTSRRLGLITDASKRFENNVSNNLVPKAVALLSKMILETSSGVIENYSDHCLVVQEENEITFTVDDVKRKIGQHITKDIIINVFDRYGYIYTVDEDRFIFIPPFFRQDLKGAHDIAEEVGRVYGYQNVEAKDLPDIFKSNTDEINSKVGIIKKFLIDQGYTEVLTYVFRKKSDIYVAHGPKDKSALRKDLATGLSDSFNLNRLNAPLINMKEVKLFEIGSVFNLVNGEIVEEVKVGIVSKSGIEEYSLDDFINKFNIVDDGESLQVSNEVHQFKSWSPYPFIVRDVAVWIPKDDENVKLQLEEIIFELKKDKDVFSIELFDSFTKDEKISFAYRIVFQSDTKTLTDEEVTSKMEPVILSISKNSTFELR